MHRAFSRGSHRKARAAAGCRRSESRARPRVPRRARATPPSIPRSADMLSDLAFAALELREADLDGAPQHGCPVDVNACVRLQGSAHGVEPTDRVVVEPERKRLGSHTCLVVYAVGVCATSPKVGA